MSTANTQLGQAIAKAGAYFQGSKVDRIVAEAKHVLKVAKEFAFLLANNGIHQEEKSLMFNHAMETARVALKAELLIRTLEHRNRISFKAKTGLDSALQDIHNKCYKLVVAYFRA